MNGVCDHCRQPATVSQFRLPGVGLRRFCNECAERLAAMGLLIDLVSDEDPRARSRRERVA